MEMHEFSFLVRVYKKKLYHKEKRTETEEKIFGWPTNGRKSSKEKWYIGTCIVVIWCTGGIWIVETVYLLIACSPSLGLCLYPYPVEYQMWANCNMIGTGPKHLNSELLLVLYSNGWLFRCPVPWYHLNKNKQKITIQMFPLFKSPTVHQITLVSTIQIPTVHQISTVHLSSLSLSLPP